MIQKANQPTAGLLHDLGFKLFPCKPHKLNNPKSKTPYANGYKKGPFLSAEVAASEGQKRSVGCLIPGGFLVFDVDVKTEQRPEKEGAESFEKLKQDFPELGEMETLRQDSPSGGQHYFYRVPAGSYHKVLKEYPGIEFLSDTGYVCTGKYWLGGRYRLDTRFEVAELPARLVDRLNKERIEPARVPVQPSTAWEAWKEEARERVDLNLIYDLTGDVDGQWLQARDPNSPSGDRNPSAGVADGAGDAKRGNFHSFRTDETIDLFEYVQRHHGADDFKAAAAYVADWSGVPLPRGRNAGEDFEPIAGEPIKLSKAFPERVAKQFLSAGVNHFAFVNGSVYRFDDHCYVEIPVKRLRNDLTKWLQDAGFERITSGGVTSVLENITARQIDRTETQFWLDPETQGLYGIEAEDLISTTRGLVDINTREFCSSTPGFFCTEALTLHNKKLDCKRWLRFLDEAIGDEEEIRELQKFFGYCLTDSVKYQKFLNLYGPTRSGKGTICRVLAALTNSVGFQLPQLGDKFGLQSFLGKRVAFDADVRGHAKPADIQILLKITGNDPVAIDRKNQETVTATLTTKLVLVSNDLLSYRDDAAAAVARTLLIQCPKTRAEEEQDPNLDEKLKQELFGILRWAIDGLKELEAAEGFVQPARSTQVLAEQRRASSPLQEFIDLYCAVGPDRRVLKDEFRNQYVNFLHLTGSKANQQPGRIGRQLKQIVPELLDEKVTVEAGRRVSRYVGIEITSYPSQNSGVSR